MLKNDFIKRVAYVSGATQETTRSVLDAAMAVTCKAVSRGESVMLFGLGKIRVTERGEKVARNLHTGERVIVPARKVVTLQASDVLTRFANKTA